MENKDQKKIIGKNILSEKSVIIWQIRVSIYMIVYMLISGIFFVFVPLAAIIMCIIGCAAYFFIIVYYFPRLCRSVSYLCESGSLIIKKGFFIRKYISISFSQIQYLVLSEGIIESKYGSCSVYVFMAGGTEILWEVSKEYAYALKELTEDYGIQKGSKENE